MEQKTVCGDFVKFSVETETGSRKFAGYGSVFKNRDDYGDVMEKGAYAKSLSHHMAAGTAPLMLLNHNMRSIPIGKWTSLEEDDYGLRLEGELLDTTDGQDVHKALKAGAINGLSVGFRAKPDGVIKRKSASDPRFIFKEVELMEISVVTFPANTRATVSQVKSLVEEGDHLAALIQLGMTEEDAISIIKSIEAKYNEAHTRRVAQTILSKLLGEK